MNAIEILRNKKIFFLGVNTGYVTDGLPNDRYIEFYRRRASPALHCAIVGNVVVPGGYGSNASTPTLTKDGVWGEIAAAIKERGSLPGIQLATAWEGYSGTRKFIGTDPTGVITAARELIDGLGFEGIAAAIDAFGEAAIMACDHGYRHIQLHGAHGYLLSLLIDSRINPTGDAVLSRLAELAGHLTSMKIETSIRISLRTGDAAFDTSGAGAFHDKIAALSFDYVDLSSGFYNIDKRLIYPSRPDFVTNRIIESRSIAERHPATNFILSGRALKHLARMPQNLHIGICRDLIANPDFLNHLDQGCRNHSKCHYFSRGEASLTCALWGNPSSPLDPLQSDRQTLSPSDPTFSAPPRAPSA